MCIHEHMHVHMHMYMLLYEVLDLEHNMVKVVNIVPTH